MAAGKFDKTPNYDDDIEFIEDSDPVQGDPPGTDPELTPLTGTANRIFQKVIGSLVYLKNAVDNFSIERMTDTVEGIGRTATQQEAEGGTAHGTGGPLLTVLRGMQLLRGSNAQANTTRRGTSRRATQAQATGLTNNEAHLTALLVGAILEHSNAGATPTKRGTVRLANETHAQDESNNTHALTAASLHRESVVNISSPNLTVSSLQNGVERVDSVTYQGSITSKYFGPILYEYEYSNTISMVIQVDERVAGAYGIVLSSESVDLTAFTWAISNKILVSGNEAPTLEIGDPTQNELRITATPGAPGASEVYRFTLTGTLI